MSHGHCCSAEHDHDHDDSTDNASKYSLYLKIDTDRLECLNEEIPDSGKSVFKSWEDRLDVIKVCLLN